MKEKLYVVVFLIGLSFLETQITAHVTTTSAIIAPLGPSVMGGQKTSKDSKENRLSNQQSKGSNKPIKKGLTRIVSVRKDQLPPPPPLRSQKVTKFKRDNRLNSQQTKSRLGSAPQDFPPPPPPPTEQEIKNMQSTEFPPPPPSLYPSQSGPQKMQQAQKPLQNTRNTRRGPLVGSKTPPKVSEKPRIVFQQSKIKIVQPTPISGFKEPTIPSIYPFTRQDITRKQLQQQAKWEAQSGTNATHKPTQSTIKPQKENNKDKQSPFHRFTKPIKNGMKKLQRSFSIERRPLGAKPDVKVKATRKKQTDKQAPAVESTSLATRLTQLINNDPPMPQVTAKLKSFGTKQHESKPADIQISTQALQPPIRQTNAVKQRTDVPHFSQVQSRSQVNGRIQHHGSTSSVHSGHSTRSGQSIARRIDVPPQGYSSRRGSIQSVNTLNTITSSYIRPRTNAMNGGLTRQGSMSSVHSGHSHMSRQGMNRGRPRDTRSQVSGYGRQNSISSIQSGGSYSQGGAPSVYNYFKQNGGQQLHNLMAYSSIRSSSSHGRVRSSVSSVSSIGSMSSLHSTATSIASSMTKNSGYSGTSHRRQPRYNNMRNPHRGQTPANDPRRQSMASDNSFYHQGSEHGSVSSFGGPRSHHGSQSRGRDTMSVTSDSRYQNILGNYMDDHMRGSSESIQRQQSVSFFSNQNTLGIVPTVKKKPSDEKKSQERSMWNSGQNSNAAQIVMLLAKVQQQRGNVKIIQKKGLQQDDNMPFWSHVLKQINNQSQTLQRLYVEVGNSKENYLKMSKLIAPDEWQRTVKQYKLMQKSTNSGIKKLQTTKALVQMQMNKAFVK